MHSFYLTGGGSRKVPENLCLTVGDRAVSQLRDDTARHTVRREERGAYLPINRHMFITAQSSR